MEKDRQGGRARKMTDVPAVERARHGLARLKAG